jgi:membrane peptidoglycan carboxypeptidase
MVGGLTYSVNTIAARLIDKVGIQKTLDMARAMGVTSTLPREFGISLGSADISLFDMMKVYGTIANHGLRPEPITVLKVTDRDGKVIYDYNTNEKKNLNKIQALSKDEADIMARMLRSVIDNGTGNKLRSQYVPDGEFSGKTGTTQNHSDGWFISFNEKLTTGCWVGGPSPAVRFRTMDLGRGAAMALPIVGNFWYKLLRDKKFNKLALAKFEENERANNVTGCPFRLGINPEQLYIMMQDTNMANEIRARRYRGLKQLAEDYFGTPVEEEEAVGGEEIEGGEPTMIPEELKSIDRKPVQIIQATPAQTIPSTPNQEIKKKGGGG